MAAKTVSFSSASPPPTSPTAAPSPRRSSLKLGTLPNLSHPPPTYTHTDPLVRRLRLRDAKGKPVDLSESFEADVKLVGFLFGAAWSGTDREPYRIVERFSERHHKRIRFVYVSVDMTEEGFLGLTRSKPWLSMEWNDGSNPSEIDASDLSLPPPAEPFLLASDVDLEEELSLSDATGTTYLRPFSRVYMAEKYQIYGVPQLMVYHLGERRVLTKHARFSTIKGDYGEDTLARWEKGESTDFGFSDVVHALRWSLGGAVLAVSYLVAVRYGGAEDVLANMSSKMMASYLGQG